MSKELTPKNYWGSRDLIDLDPETWFDGLSIFNYNKDSEWAPNWDITSDNQNYYVKMDLPGMKREDLKVHYSDETQMFTVEGNRVVERENLSRQHVAERLTGSFFKSIRIQDVDVNNIKAELKDGVLNVTLPKIAQPEPKKIDINVQ